LGRSWTVDVEKKGAAMGERELGGDAQPKAVVGADVRLEVAGEEEANTGVVTARAAYAEVVTGTREATARVTSGPGEAARAKVLVGA
jgi:hypothetical protein